MLVEVFGLYSNNLPLRAEHHLDRHVSLGVILLSVRVPVAIDLKSNKQIGKQDVRFAFCMSPLCRIPNISYSTSIEKEHIPTLF